MDELKRKFRQLAYTCSFMGQSKTQIDAFKLIKAHDLDLETLAQFHYLLSDQLVFEYQESPQTRHYDSSPTLILVFEFLKKGPITRPMIEKRIEAFEASLHRFLSRRDLSELAMLAKVPTEPQHSKLLATTEILKTLEEIAIEKRTVPAKPPIYSKVEPDPDTARIMDRKGIKRLYCHQQDAISYLKDGYNIIVSTATASGKTFIFHAPVISALEEHNQAETSETKNEESLGTFDSTTSGPACAPATSLFIYPTKALAQDQFQIFQSLTRVKCGTFDGDTELDQRAQLTDAQALFTNPDTLHYTILPRWSDNWQDFLSELRYVVIDEIHTYKGVFGAHVALILRRLRRICSSLGNDTLQFICCSATIERPLDFMQQLTGLSKTSLKLVANDGSPHAMKTYYFLCCPDGHPLKTGASIVVQLANNGFKTIAFCKYRKECELLMRAIRQTPGKLDGIMSYRGGYSKQDRRQIEHDMFENKLKGIIATSALEVGIDIGSLDAVVLCGFPSSLASLRQQIGRVGRRDRESIVVYIAGKHFQDQTFILNPDLMFESKDPDIPLGIYSSVIEAHLQCAAYEMGLGEDDLQFFEFQETPKCLEKLEYLDSLYHCTWLPNPAKRVNIRHIEEQSTAIIDVTDHRNICLETIESYRVGFTAYPGAIYVHQGLPYLVLDLEENLSHAKVMRTNVKWTTRQRDYTDVDPLESFGHSTLKEDTYCQYGTIHVKTVVFGYFKVDERNRIIDSHDLTLPPVERVSNGLWVNLPASTLEVLSQKQLNAAASIHAAEHIFMKFVGEFVPGSVSDIATECKAPEKEFAKKLTSRRRPARLIFYQRYTGEEGRNFWSQVHPQVQNVVTKVLQVLDACECESGCAKCVALSTCSEKNIVLSKRGAQVIYRLMCSKDVQDIDDGPEQHLERALNGTVVASGVQMC